MTTWTDVVGAIAAAVTALLAGAAIVFAWYQLRIAAASRDDVTRPYVVAHLEPLQEPLQFVDLVVRNYGQTAAYNVDFKADPPLARTRQGRPSEPVFVFSSMPTLAPGQEWRTYFDFGPDRLTSDLAVRNRVTLTYKRHPDDHEALTTTCDLDWSVLFGARTIERKGLRDIAKSLDRIARAMNDTRRGGRVQVGLDWPDETPARRRIRPLPRALIPRRGRTRVR